MNDNNSKIWNGIILMILLTSVFAFEGFGQPGSKDQLTRNIDQLISQSNLGEPVIGILAQTGKTGEILYERNADTPMKPASCNKIQTSAAALYYLGPGYRFSTPLYIKGDIEGKTLNGDLVIIGSGDPSFSGRFIKDTNDLVWIFRDWAKALEELGIKKITGDIIGDDDYFDDEYFGKGWYPDERGEWYCAEISSLSFNDNCMDVFWKGTSRVGKPASYTLNPKTGYIQFLNEVVTGKKGSEKQLSFHRKDKTNVIIARGQLPKGQKSVDWCTVYNPTLYFTTVLKETLESEGVKVLGSARDLDDDPEKKKLLRSDPPTDLVATYESPPLMTLLDVVNTPSQNCYAELIFKTIGKKIGGEGAFIKSAEMVQEFLNRENLAENGSVIIDGSGLSYLNRVTPRQLVNVLRYMSRQSWWPELLNTLPRGQTKGYLKDIFGETPERKAIATRIYGKTGYIGGVVGLTGVVYTEKGTEICYSILINDFKGSVEDARKLANNIAIELAQSRLP